MACMNYISIINAFWDLATTNPLSTGQVSLYFALLHVCNRSNWTEWFQAPNQVLSVLTGLSRSGILKARNELKQKGLIDFKERGTKATLYKLMADSTQESKQKSKQAESTIANSKQVGVQDSKQADLPDTDTIANSVQESKQKSKQVHTTIANSTQDSKQDSKQDSTQVGVQVGKQAGAQANNVLINNNIITKKQKQNINETESPPISPIGRLDEFLSVYPKKCNRYLTEREYATLLLTGAVTEDSLVNCAQNYAQSCRILGTQEKFIKNAENFLREFVFEQYLPGNYKKPVPPRSGNTFKNFTPSTTSYDDLMRQRLKKRMEANG